MLVQLEEGEFVDAFLDARVTQETPRRPFTDGKKVSNAPSAMGVGIRYNLPYFIGLGG